MLNALKCTRSTHLLPQDARAPSAQHRVRPTQRLCGGLDLQITAAAAATVVGAAHSSRGNASAGGGLGGCKQRGSTASPRAPCIPATAARMGKGVGAISSWIQEKPSCTCTEHMRGAWGTCGPKNVGLAGAHTPFSQPTQAAGKPRAHGSAFFSARAVLSFLLLFFSSRTHLAQVHRLHKAGLSLSHGPPAGSRHRRHHLRPQRRWCGGGGQEAAGVGRCCAGGTLSALAATQRRQKWRGPQERPRHASAALVLCIELPLCSGRSSTQRQQKQARLSPTPLLCTQGLACRRPTCPEKGPYTSSCSSAARGSAAAAAPPSAGPCGGSTCAAARQRCVH